MSNEEPKPEEPLPTTREEMMKLWMSLPAPQAARLLERWIAAHPGEGADRPRYKGVVFD